MSNNVIFTPKVYAKLTLMDLGGGLHVARNMSTRITPEFAKKDYKIGDTCGFYKPLRFVAGSGIGWDPQPIQEVVNTIKVQQISHVHYVMDSVERTLDIKEAMRLYTRPTALALASDINAKSADQRIVARTTDSKTRQTTIVYKLVVTIIPDKENVCYWDIRESLRQLIKPNLIGNVDALAVVVYYFRDITEVSGVVSRERQESVGGVERNRSQ